MQNHYDREPLRQEVNPTMATTFKRIGIAGSGIMGAGIAEVAATAGHEVLVRSRSEATGREWHRRFASSLDRQVDKGKLTAPDAEAALGRARPVTDLGELDGCDLVVESVVEDADVKRDLFRELDRVCSPSTILVTNTSTLSVTELAGMTDRADRFCGLHFFNPAPKMPIVEVVPTSGTSEDTVESVLAFARACGKTPVVVKDRAGFVVNALLFPYLNTAVKLLESGTASRDDIDAAMKGGCGFPMGPLELLDLVGLDTSVAILETLEAAAGDGCSEPAPMLRSLVADGNLGRKTGRGFYEY